MRRSRNAESEDNSNRQSEISCEGCYDQLTGTEGNEKRRMSKVRINDLARELEVKSKQILDALEAMGLAEGKTHSSSIESGEAERVRGHFERGSRAGSSRAATAPQPKIDLSNISKPGDALKAILARKREEEQRAQQPYRPANGSTPPAVVVRPASAATAAPARPATPAPPARVVTPPAAARPEPRRIVPQPRQAPPIVVAPPPANVVRPAATVARPAANVMVTPPARPAAARRGFGRGHQAACRSYRCAQRPGQAADHRAYAGRGRAPPRSLPPAVQSAVPQSVPAAEPATPAIAAAAVTAPPGSSRCSGSRAGCTCGSPRRGRCPILCSSYRRCSCGRNAGCIP